MTIQRLNEILLGVALPLSFVVYVGALLHFVAVTSPVHGALIAGSFIIYNVVKSMVAKTVSKKQTEAALQILKQYQNNGENR